MKHIAFLNACDRAEAGEEVTYHFGCLMRDRVEGAIFDQVNATAIAAFDLMEQGKVRLLQRKRPEGTEYIARKLPAPYVKPEWEGCYGRHRVNTKPRMRDLPGVMAAAALARASSALTGATGPAGVYA